MRLSKLILPILAIGKFTAGTASTCSNNFPGIEAGGVCCEAVCGTCGGSGCGTRVGTDNKVHDCCTTSAKAKCSVAKKAPCIVDNEVGPSTTPSAPYDSSKTCSNNFPGIEAGGVCCDAACGTCGGAGCGSRYGSDGSDCCTSTPKTKCSVSKKAPCIVDNAVPGPSPSSPSPSPSTSDLEYIGCYKDKAEPDRLFDHVKTDKSMTPEMCASACKGKALFGTQYGTECYCSSSKTGYGIYGTSDQCTMACGGDDKQKCGGRYAMMVYHVPSSSPSPSPSPSGGSFSCAAKNGVLNSKGDVCCKAECGQCGGSGCGKRGGDLTGDDCCTSNISSGGDKCSESGKPPCYVDEAASPTPTLPTSGEPFTCSGKYGILKGDICCSPGCGTCGGSGCGKRGEGLTGDDCCTSRIMSNGKSCSTHGAPCVMDEAADPAPSPPSGGPFVCDGVLSSKGDVCCKGDCGQCGGTGCGKRGGDLTGDDCCIGNIISDGPLCSEAGQAPCYVDEEVSSGPTPMNVVGPSPTPTPVPSNCGSKRADIDISSDTIKLTGGGCATLTDIYNAQPSDGPLHVLSSADSKTGSASANPTGYWLLTNDLKVYDDVTLYVQGKGKGGDCDVLRIQSTGSKAWEIMGHGGNLMFDGTKVTSWDTGSGKEQTNYKKKRAYLRCITEYDDSDKYSCDGHSRKDMGTCRMDLIDSTFGNMGWADSESYGLTWKVRGLCKNLSNVEFFDKRNVYGDIKGSDIYGMYYGMYSYGHQSGVWTHNKMHDNIQYGFDPHDDSDDLTIAYNQVYNNGNHGIIASKRCNNVKIYENDVYNGDEVGIMLHRSSDKAEVYKNRIWGNKNAGIAFFESMDGKIYDNTITGCDDCEFGIRLSLGSADNVIENNTLDNFSRYGLYTYKGNDEKEASSDGRPRDNKFIDNTVKNVEVGANIKDSRDITLRGNTFTNVKKFQFESSKDTVWSNNNIGDACITDSADFASGSIPRC